MSDGFCFNTEKYNDTFITISQTLGEFQLVNWRRRTESFLLHLIKKKKNRNNLVNFNFRYLHKFPSDAFINCHQVMKRGKKKIVNCKPRRHVSER